MGVSRIYQDCLLAKWFIEGSYDYSFVEGTGHLLQVEKPDECIKLTLQFLGKHGLA